MGLCRCEVVIKGLLAKSLMRKLAPFGVGMAVTGSISGVLVFPTHYVNAAPCCTDANTATPGASPEASKDLKNPESNIHDIPETGYLEQSSATTPTLSLEENLSPLSLGDSDAEGEPLFHPSISLPEYDYEMAFSTTALSTSAARLDSIQNAPHTSASPSFIEHLPATGPNSLGYLTQRVAWQPSPTNEERPHPVSVSKAASGLLGTPETVHQNSRLKWEDFSAFSVFSLSPTKLMPLRGESFLPSLFLPARLPTTPPSIAQNLKPNPNQDRFLQPSTTPAPLAPDSTSPNQPSPSPSLEIPDLDSPTQSPPIPKLEIPDSDSPTQPSPIQPSPTPTPTTEPSPTPTQPSPTPTPTTEPSTQTIPVKTIKVTGSTVFGSPQLNPIVQPYEGRTLSLEQLREVADKITQLYLDQGYITSRAILANQVIPPDGVVEIAVIEGSLEEIQVEGTRRVKPGYIRSRVQLGTSKPLNTGKLEDQLRLLRADPLFDNVEASLRAGKGVGQSILIVRVVEADPFEGSVGIDNYSPPSVGSERLGLNLLYRNLTGYGDEIAASYYHTTTSGADSFDFSYRIPLNPMNGTLQLRAAPSRNQITDPSVPFGDQIEGQSELYEISFRQPLIRSPREELALSLGFTYQEGQTFLFGEGFPFGIGPDENGGSSTRVIKFGQDYLRRDVKGAWSLRSLFSFGIGALGATTNPDPIPDGRFVSWLGQIQRVQILNEDNFLIVGTDIQLTPDSLLPSQQFVIGGGQSLRGYRQNIRSGDNGVRFSVEDRITLQRNEAGASIFQLAPFFDAGVVWNKSDNPNNQYLPSQRFLAGIGLGLIWEAQPGLSLRVDYGHPLIKVDDRGDNAQDQGFYFSVRYQF
ncbi:MAG TPA: ShlB/FhaC/HecB family hemolysin secretion/activation protein [Stenomitos sp.]